MKQINWVLCN